MYFYTDGKLYTGDNRELSKSFLSGALVIATTGSDENGTVLSSGLSEGWTGLVSGGNPVPGTDYYLGNSGNIITKGSIAYSEYIVYIGRAIDTDTLDVKIRGPEPTRNQDDGTPIGEVVEWSVNSDLSDIPDGYLPCDGSAISRANYSELDSLMSAASYPWGNGDGSTTFNLPKGIFDSDWIAMPNITNAEYTINHGLKNNLAELDVQILLSKTGSESDSFEAISESSASDNWGYNLWNIDTDNIKLQTGAAGVPYLRDSDGVFSSFGLTGYYKAIVTQKTMSARSIIKVEHITTAGEPISAEQKIIDWSSTSTWTPGNSIILNHGLGVEFDKYVWQIFVRDDLVPDKLYDATYQQSYVAGYYGQRLQGIDGDLANCTLKILSSNSQYIDSSGTFQIVPTSGWSYKVVLTRILKVATYADTSFRKVYDIADATDYTFTLPDASTQLTEYIIKRRGSGAGKVTITPSGTDKIELEDQELSSLIMVGTSTLVLFPSGRNWEVKSFKGSVLIDWSSTSTWTAGNSITLNHNLDMVFDEYTGQIFVRNDSVPNKIWNVTDIETAATGIIRGQRLNGIDGDLDNCFLQLRSGNASGYITDSGAIAVVPTSGWSYKVKLKFNF